MRSFTFAAVALLAGLLPSTTFAQTHTNCNPLNTTGCPEMPALGGNATFNFNNSIDTKLWTQQNQGSIAQGNNGTAFTISKSGDSPTLKSNFYLFFGRVEIVMQAAPGQGIISSAILESDDLDEIDWEFMGSNSTYLFTNYYGKGNTTSNQGQPDARGIDYPASSSPQEGFHNYTTDWTKDRIQWWVDGKLLRELTYDNASVGTNGSNYPQTPMTIRLGSWAGGDTKTNAPGVVQWAGGATDFSKGPFNMYVQSLYAQDYTTGNVKEYSWANMDSSGDWQKVKIINGTSAAIKEVNEPHGVANKWKALSKGVKIAIVASIAGFFIISGCLITFCCIKQRRAGRREFAALQVEQDKEASELLAYKHQMASGHFGMGNNRI